MFTAYDPDLEDPVIDENGIHEQPWVCKGTIKFGFVQRSTYCYNHGQKSCFDGTNFRAPHEGRYIFHFMTKALIPDVDGAPHTTQLRIILPQDN